MSVYAFDTSAVMRFLERETGHEQVAVILERAGLRHCEICISAVNWGEVLHTVTKRYGNSASEALEISLLALGLTIVPATAERAKRAAMVRLQYKIGYADCFGVELAADSPDHILVTADYGTKPAEQYVAIEFLPTKPKQ